MSRPNREDGKKQQQKNEGIVVPTTGKSGETARQYSEIEISLKKQWSSTRRNPMKIELIKLGATVMKLGEMLEFPAGNSTSKNRFTPKEKTLKHWLKVHCPEIRYNTAIGYRDAAKGLEFLIGNSRNVSLLDMLNNGLDNDKQNAENDAYSRIIKVLENTSLSALKQKARCSDGKKPSSNTKTKTMKFWKKLNCSILGFEKSWSDEMQITEEFTDSECEEICNMFNDTVSRLQNLMTWYVNQRKNWGADKRILNRNKEGRNKEK